MPVNRLNPTAISSSSTSEPPVNPSSAPAAPPTPAPNTPPWVSGSATAQCQARSHSTPVLASSSRLNPPT